MSRGLLVAAIALAILGGGVYWSERTKKAEEGKPSPDAPPKLITITDEKDAKRLEIQHKGGDKVILERDKSGQWQMTSPKPDRVDPDVARTMTSTFTDVKWERLIEEKPTDLSAFGLNDPSLTATIVGKDGKPQTLLIGDSTPTHVGYFGKLANDPRVFLVASNVNDQLSKSAEDIRDKHLLIFEPEKLVRVEVAAKGQAFEFGKNANNEWQIVKPQVYRADGLQVEELARKLHEAKMDSTEPSFGSAAPVGVVKFTDNSGTHQIEVRKLAKDNTYLAKGSALEGIHKISAEVGDAVAKPLADYRNKKLFDFGFNDPTKVEVRDGEKTYVFEKKAEKWNSAGKEMDSASTQILIDKLRDLAATSFPAAGFTKPDIDINVTSKAGKLVEHVSISKAGDNYFAKREGEPAIYQLDKKAVEDIQHAAADVKPPPPANKTETKK